MDYEIPLDPYELEDAIEWERRHFCRRLRDLDLDLLKGVSR